MKGRLITLVIGGRSKVKFTFYFIFGNIKSCAFKDTFYPRIYLLNIFYRSIFWTVGALRTTYVLFMKMGTEVGMIEKWQRWL